MESHKMNNFLPYWFMREVDSTVEGDGDVIRLSLNESSYGVSDLAKEFFRQELEKVNVYSDNHSDLLKSEIAKQYSLSKSQIVVGNGIDDLLCSVVHVLKQKKGIRLTTEKTVFGDHNHMGDQLQYVPLENYRISSLQIHERILEAKQASQKVSAIYLSNPHNPTGAILNRFQLDDIVSFTEREGIILVVDEAYAEFVDSVEYSSAIKYLKEKQHVLVLRSFSKAYGMRDLDCGYAMGHESLMEEIASTRQAISFHVNRFTASAAIGSLKDQSFLEHVRIRNKEAREDFMDRMKKFGIYALKSNTNFVLLKLNVHSKEFCNTLLERHGIMVKDAGCFGFYKHVRISMPNENSMKYVCDSILKTVLHLTKKSLMMKGS
jgi:histidinol-phosphate aminotransferase